MARGPKGRGWGKKILHVMRDGDKVRKKRRKPHLSDLTIPRLSQKGRTLLWDNVSFLPFFFFFFFGKDLDHEPPKGFDNVFLVRVSMLIFYSPFLPFHE